MNDGATGQKPNAVYWIVSVLGLLWNANGGFDYVMTRMRNTDYLSQMGDPQVMLDYIDSFPLWAQAGWGLGVWASVLGSVLMLARSRHAVGAFIASLIGAVISFAHQFTSDMPPEFDTTFGKIMPFVIMGVIVLLWWYCRKALAKGWLK